MSSVLSMWRRTNPMNPGCFAPIAFSVDKSSQRSTSRRATASELPSAIYPTSHCAKRWWTWASRGQLSMPSTAVCAESASFAEQVFAATAGMHAKLTVVSNATRKRCIKWMGKLCTMTAPQATMLIPVGGGACHWCTVVDNFDGRQRTVVHACGDCHHCFVRCPDASHRRMRRTWKVAGIRASGMYPDTRMARNGEPYDSVQAIWTVCIWLVTSRCSSVRYCVRAVLNMGQCRVSVDIIVGSPSARHGPVVAHQTDLMGEPVEYQLCHGVS